MKPTCWGIIDMLCSFILIRVHIWKCNERTHTHTLTHTHAQTQTQTTLSAVVAGARMSGQRQHKQKEQQQQQQQWRQWSGRWRSTCAHNHGCLGLSLDCIPPRPTAGAAAAPARPVSALFRHRCLYIIHDIYRTHLPRPLVHNTQQAVNIAAKFTVCRELSPPTASATTQKSLRMSCSS